MKLEHERRVEALVEDVKQLTKEMQLQELLINYTVPPEFQDLIEKVLRKGVRGRGKEGGV